MAIDVTDKESEELISRLEQRAQALQQLLGTKNDQKNPIDRATFEREKLLLTNLFINALEAALRARVAAASRPECAETNNQLIDGIGRVSAVYGSVFDLKETKGTIEREMKALRSPYPRQMGRFPIRKGR